jgi:hypothetical protein
MPITTAHDAATNPTNCAPALGDHYSPPTHPTIIRIYTRNTIREQLCAYGFAGAAV